MHLQKGYSSWKERELQTNKHLFEISPTGDEATPVLLKPIW